MNQHSDHLGAFRPEHLAAYVDGELDVALERKVENWLLRNPDVANEIGEHRRLEELWRNHRPEEPSEAQWAFAEARCAERLASYSAVRSVVWQKARPRLLPAVTLRTFALGALAATLLLAVTLGPLPPRAENGSAVDEFPVLSPGDVNIISVDPADMGALVIGEAPMSGPFVAAAPGDVSVTSMRPAMDGVVPVVRVASGSSSVPMIVAPIRHDTEKENDP
jgi:hypothetical protein